MYRCKGWGHRRRLLTCFAIACFYSGLACGDGDEAGTDGRASEIPPPPATETSATPARCMEDLDCPSGIACVWLDPEHETGHCDVDDTAGPFASDAGPATGIGALPPATAQAGAGDDTLTVEIAPAAPALCAGDCVSLQASARGNPSSLAYEWVPQIGAGPGPHRVCPEASTSYRVRATQPARPGDEFATRARSGTASVTVAVTDCEGGVLPPDGGMRPPGMDAGSAGPIEPGEDAGAPTTTTGTLLPVLRPVGSGVAHTCAVLDNGAVKCWGYDGYAELGYEDVMTRGDDPGEMGEGLPAVSLGTGLRARAMFAGYYTSCAMLDDARLKCWGYSAGAIPGAETNRSGHVLMGDALPLLPLPTRPAMAAGTATHVCAVLVDGTARCWGRDAGVLDGEAQRVHDFGETARIRRLAVDDGHACAIFDGGHVRCWGSNRGGQLGLGDLVERPEWSADTPVIDLGSGAVAVAITVSSSHSCAVLDGGAVKCWGWNSYGQLGLGDRDPRGDQPEEMGDALPSVPLGAGARAIDIAAGGRFTCALLEGGTIKCWGRNNWGQLGQGHANDLGDEPGEMGDALRPVALGAGRVATAFDAGGEFVCAALDDRSLKCWGHNDYGQLGQGHTSDLGDEPGEMGDALPTVDLGAHLLGR